MHHPVYTNPPIPYSSFPRHGEANVLDAAPQVLSSSRYRMCVACASHNKNVCIPCRHGSPYLQVWIAPSGGRDRKNAAGDWVPAEFDIDAVELMRALGAKSPNPTWLYPFAMATNAIMPPPDTRAQGTLGEKRIVNFTGVALSVGEAFAASGEGWLPEGMELGTEAAKQHLTDQIFEVVNDEYDVIKNVMKGFGDGTYVVPNGKQPWKEGARSPVEL